ncbi:hypothetical protein [Terriglobus aquaticus]|uniref:Uncharacterized protein n=1 Tax=Terriglobus aquaticus TaxID=940139 RepID=A0ABW9KFW6_9BACT|nr:hypothetical protein [Terriglobus aquaticus]
MSDRWSEMDDLDLLQLEAEMRQDLDDLREAATVYADRAWSRAGMTSASTVGPRAATGRGWLAWAAAGVAAAALTVGGVRLAHHSPSPQGTSTAAADGRSVRVQPASTVTDEALLDQIQSDLSTGVPAAMEPLQASEVHDSRASQNVVRQ